MKWDHFLNLAQLPLTIRLPLTITTLVVTAVVSITLLSLVREQRHFHSELELRAEAMLDMLASAADDALYNLDADALTQLTSGLNQHRANGILLGRIYDPDGRLVADMDHEGGVSAFAPDPLGQQLVAATTTRFLWETDRLIAGRTVYAGHERLGAISLGLSTAALDAKLGAVRNEGFAVALAAAIAGTMLALLTSQSILRPVKAMGAATRRVAAGDLQHKVAVSGSSELVLLATNFNAMVDQLRTMIEREKEYQADLIKLMHARSDAVRAVVHDLGHTVQVTQSALDTWALQLADVYPVTDVLEMGQKRLQATLDQQRDLLQDMRDAALLESGNLVMQPQATPLDDLVRQTAATLAPRFELAECTLSVTSDPALPPVWCDPRRIRRVIHNLLENALRYTSSIRDDGEVCVHLSAQGDAVVCRITDNGQGIAPDQLHRLGQKFTRIARGDHVPEGMGLGLNFSIGILKLSGGQLTIDSPGEGCGTTVMLSLPCAPLPA